MSKTKTIDLSSATSAAELHETLAAAFEFPGYYGENWDAFWDCITEDRWLPDVLILAGLDSLEERLPREASLLLKTLGDYNNEHHGHTCAVEVGDDYGGPLFSGRSPRPS